MVEKKTPNWMRTPTVKATAERLNRRSMIEKVKLVKIRATMNMGIKKRVSFKALAIDVETMYQYLDMGLEKT